MKMGLYVMGVALCSLRSLGLYCFQQVYTKKPQVDGSRQVDARHNDDILKSGVNASRLFSLFLSRSIPFRCSVMMDTPTRRMGWCIYFET